MRSRRLPITSRWSILLTGVTLREVAACPSESLHTFSSNHNPTYDVTTETAALQLAYFPTSSNPSSSSSQSFNYSFK
jgi:hypothetical protein